MDLHKLRIELQKSYHIKSIILNTKFMPTIGKLFKNIMNYAIFLPLMTVRSQVYVHLA